MITDSLKKVAGEALVNGITHRPGPPGRLGLRAHADGLCIITQTKKENKKGGDKPMD